MAGIRAYRPRRLLVIEGGLREDEFNGGYSLRAERCWDFTQICNQQAQRIAIRLDLRHPHALACSRTSRPHAGTTPVLLEVITAAGIGRLTLNGGRWPARGCPAAKPAAQPAGDWHGQRATGKAVGQQLAIRFGMGGGLG